MTCDRLSRVDQHFARTLSFEDERAMREHLPGCADCRARYQALRVVDRAVSGESAAKDRLGAALGFAPAVKPRSFGRVGIGAFATAVLAAGVVWWGTAQGGFTARGGGGSVPTASLEVYRVSPTGMSDRAVAMNAGDGLAFAYRNAAQRKFVAIFAVTARGRVFWYHPAWTSEDQTPVAIPAEPGAAAHELNEAVIQKLPPGKLTVYGLFIDRPVTVREVEAALPDLAKAFPGAEVFTTPIVVVP